MRDSGLCCEGPKVRAASFTRCWGGKLLLASAAAQDPRCFGVSAGTLPSSCGGQAVRARLSSGVVRGAEDAIWGSHVSLTLSGLFR